VPCFLVIVGTLYLLELMSWVWLQHTYRTLK